MTRKLTLTIASTIALLQGLSAQANPAAVPSPAIATPVVEARGEFARSATPIASELDALMAYVLRTRELSPEQLLAEAGTQKRLAEAKNDIATLKFALLLSDQPAVPESEVMGILQPLFEDARGTKPELRAFALLISRDMQDRKRMKETLAATQGRLKDAQKTQEVSDAKAAQMRRQIDELQNKINAFMMMEQSILKRGR